MTGDVTCTLSDMIAQAAKAAVERPPSPPVPQPRQPQPARKPLKSARKIVSRETITTKNEKPKLTTPPIEKSISKDQEKKPFTRKLVSAGPGGACGKLNFPKLRRPAPERKNIKIPGSAINPVYLDHLADMTPTQIFFGGASSGKSVFLAQRAVVDVCHRRNYLIVRNTATSLRSSAFNEVRKVISSWDLSSLFEINKSEMTITSKSGAQILFKGLDDTEKIKSVTPENGVITDIWVEEATECAEDDIKQLEKRLRGESKHPKRLILSFNPILKSHWIFNKYFGGFHDCDTKFSSPDLLILKTTYKDNQFLTPEDAARLENEADPYWRNVYTLGNWGVLGDVIFKSWRVEDLDPSSGQWDNLRNGLDFGFGPDPAAFIQCNYDAKRQKLYILQELSGHELTNKDLSDMVRSVAGRGRVVCDSSEPKSIRELQLLGINAVPAEKGRDSVNFGIQWLSRQEIIINRKCQGVINEFQKYQWKKSRGGESLPIPADRDNHHIDALRYALEDCMAGVMPIMFASTSKKRATERMARY